MPTGTKIVAIALVVLLGVAGLYYVASSPSPNTSKSSAAKESSSNSTNSGTSVGNTPPTLTLTPGVAGTSGAVGTTPSNTAGTAANPTPTGAFASGANGTNGVNGASRPQPPFVPGAAAPSGSGKGDSPAIATNATTGNSGIPTGTATGNTTGGTSNFNGIATGATAGNPAGAVGTGGAAIGAPRLANGISRPGTGNTASGTNGSTNAGNGTTIATGPSGNGGPTPTGAGLPTGTVPAGATGALGTSPNTTALAPNATTSNGERTHVIASGETFEALAQKYYNDSTKWTVISKANPTAEPERLKIGQKIRIPAAPNAAVATNATLDGQAIATGTPAPTARTTGSANASSSNVHVVAKGDTLSSISRKYFGSDKHWREILAVNKGVSEKNLKIGQKLVIPAREAIAGAENTGRSGS